MPALDDVRVLVLSNGWTASALSGRLLAELGADVCKWEPPGGDALRRRPPLTAEGESYAFTLVAAGTRSVVAPPAALPELLASCDVLLAEAALWQQLAGPAPDVLAQRYPRLVACLVSPYGWEELPRHAAWSELVLQATSGLMATTGYPEDPPQRAGVPVVTHGAALFALIAVLAALAERRHSGRGQVIDLAGFDVALSFLGTFLPHYFRHHTSPRRMGNRHPLAVPWNTYPARDGWLVLCSMGDSAWQRLLEVLGREDLKAEARFATAEQRFAHAEEVDALIAAWSQQHTVAEAVKRLNAAGIAAGPIVSVPQFLQHPYCQERRLLVQVPTACGNRIATLGPLFKLSATPGVVDRGAPALGQNGRTAPHLPPAPLANIAGAMPLAGVRVVEMGTYTAVPYGTRLLALLGAEVIKVEPRKGEPLRHLAIPLDGTHRDSYAFHLYNTGKKSVTLDVQHPQGKALLLALLAKAHVFVHNLAQSYIEAVGLDYATLHAAYPRLVYCAVSGFGQHSTWRQRRAFDTILQAFGGIMDLTGLPQRPPVKVGISLIDLFGALFATAGILVALHHLWRSGQGQCVDVALGDVAAWLTSEVWPLALTGKPVSRCGNRHWFAAPHNLYRTQDGEVVLAVEDDAQWQALLRLIGREDLGQAASLATAAGRVEAAEALDRLVQAWLASLPSAEALQRCQEAGIPAARVREVGDAVEDPRAAARQVIITHEGHRLLGAPLHLSRTPLAAWQLAPALGAHNAEVFGQLLGLSASELATLRAQGVI
ncbi:MAG: CoA transferase [Candidatus Tectimicrobiota bacterium]|nr:MAG: CoA transferase [Candidatus Tectomicrobia bacterium]